MAPYGIKSVNTNYCVISTAQDKVGQQIDTKDGKDTIPPDAVLDIHPPLAGPVTLCTIKGMGNLYVALDVENTKLTWSEGPFIWSIRLTGAGSYVITPPTYEDLYWCHELNGVGDHVEVRVGKNIEALLNKWEIIRFG